ncbi:MAG: 16S rRNA (guanine527-N7)-methyltransferase [Parvibaculaceae bacterium]|jgi:16S rRNA (guanine527-N7)-methyltransferase|nr:16S rRNA (guanine(527)-N(7))-methyltransferase RsmG [Parvibaculaceae bacterium]
MPQVIDAESFFRFANVSRETVARLSLYESVLIKWQKAINLVSKGTLEDLWQRHFLDSAQLMGKIPDEAQTLVDLGSGGGFPGAILAILLAEKRPDMDVHLVDSDQRKCTFVREACRAAGVKPTVHSVRIEQLTDLKADVVTARALAPLPKLLGLSAPFWKENTVGLYLKGEGATDELTQARKYWKFDSEMEQSQSSETGVVLQVTGLGHVES